MTTSGAYFVAVLVKNVHVFIPTLELQSHLSAL